MQIGWMLVPLADSSDVFTLANQGDVFASGKTSDIDVDRDRYR